MVASVRENRKPRNDVFHGFLSCSGVLGAQLVHSGLFPVHTLFWGKGAIPKALPILEKGSNHLHELKIFGYEESSKKKY